MCDENHEIVFNGLEKSYTLYFFFSLPMSLSQPLPFSVRLVVFTSGVSLTTYVWPSSAK